MLRRIIRRALRHGHKLGQPRPFFHRLVADLDQAMGEAYPELRAVRDRVADVLLQEEQRFGETLEHGMAILETALAGGITTLDGEPVGHGAARGKPGPAYARIYEAYQRAKHAQLI